MENLAVLLIYVIASMLFLIAGLVVMFSGMATNKKPIKLAGIVISVMAFQVLAILAFFFLLAVLAGL